MSDGDLGYARFIADMMMISSLPFLALAFLGWVQVVTDPPYLRMPVEWTVFFSVLGVGLSLVPSAPWLKKEAVP